MGGVARDLAVYFLFMTAATSFVSLPMAPATLLAAKTVPPIALAIAAAVASACASVLDWHLVRRVFRLSLLARVRQHRIFRRAERWAAVAPFWTTLLFASVPLPFNVVRVLMPLSGYPCPRYVGAVALGRFFRIFVIATFGATFDVPNEVLIALFAMGLVGAIATLVQQLRERAAVARAAAAAAAGAEPPA